MPHGLGELTCLARHLRQPLAEPPGPPRTGASFQPAPSPALGLPPFASSAPFPALPCPALPDGWGCCQYLQICLYLLAPPLPAPCPRAGGSPLGGLHAWGGSPQGSLLSMVPKTLADAVCLLMAPVPALPLGAGNRRATFHLLQVMCPLGCGSRWWWVWGAVRGGQQGPTGTLCNKLLV